MMTNIELSNAMDYLASLSKRDAGAELQDIAKLSECIKVITETNVERDSGVCFKTIETFLKNSPALKSADFLEDYFDFDFEATDPAFEVDYSGKYTYVPDRLLSDSLLAERKQTLLLTQYYIESLFAKTILRPKLKYLTAPDLKIGATELIKINLCKSVLPGCEFTDCRFETVNLWKSNLQNSTFIRCHFFGVNFDDSILKGAQFIDCTFQAGSLSYTKADKVTFTNCRFAKVKITGTNFGSIDFSSCNFDQCWVNNTDMTQISGLTQSQIDRFYGDASVVLPENFQRPSFWPEQSDIGTWSHWINTGESTESTACLTYK